MGRHHCGDSAQQVAFQAKSHNPRPNSVMVRLLLTRPEAAARRFGEGLALPGVEIVISPILSIQPTHAAAPTEPWSSVIVTSQHALSYYIGPTGMPACVVGQETAKATAAAGFDVTAVAPDARRLIDGLPPKLPEPLLYLRGRHVAQPLADMLRNRGHRVLEWSVYDQVAQPLSADAIAALQSTDPVILPLFSPRSAGLVSAALAELERRAPLFVVAMSDAVAQCFTAKGTAQISVCPEPNASYMTNNVQVVAQRAALLESKGSLS